MGQTDKYRYIIQILVQQKSKYISQVNSHKKKLFSFQ